MIATSMEFWATETVRQNGETMARQQVFKSVGDDRLSRVKPEGCIIRVNRRPSKDEARRGGERLNVLPGFIITYNGHTRDPSGGENCVDDGQIRVLIQLCDDADDGDATNLASYLALMSSVRKRLLSGADGQASPLEDCPSALGQIFFVHVREASPPDETDYGFHEQMRMAMVCEMSTRTTR